MAKFIIFATYYQQLDSCQTLIQSLLNQTFKDWELHIHSNGDNSIKQLEICDSRINTKITKPTEYWGCYNRESFRTSLPLGSYIINTSVEDYYAPITLEEINKHTEELIYWDFSHHHFNYETSRTESKPSICNIDWGNFAVKTDIALNVPIQDCKSYTADGEWVEAVKNKIIEQGGGIKKIPKVLFVKN